MPRTGRNMLLVDVREPEEPKSSASRTLWTVAACPSVRTADIPDPQGRQVFFRCRSGNRSVLASLLCRKDAGYPDSAPHGPAHPSTGSPRAYTTETDSWTRRSTCARARSGPVIYSFLRFLPASSGPPWAQGPTKLCQRLKRFGLHRPERARRFTRQTGSRSATTPSIPTTRSNQAAGGQNRVTTFPSVRPPISCNVKIKPPCSRKLGTSLQSLPEPVLSGRRITRRPWPSTSGTTFAVNYMWGRPGIRPTRPARRGRCLARALAVRPLDIVVSSPENLAKVQSLPAFHAPWNSADISARSAAPARPRIPTPPSEPEIVEAAEFS